MKIINIHKRTLNQPKDKIAELFSTLATENDKIWPLEKWPRIRFKNGFVEGSEGGHGPIRYVVEKYKPHEMIEFRFKSPKGFDGIHRFELTEKENNHTELKHIIDMNTNGLATLKWLLGIRWLHDALLEDAFDKAENHFSNEQKKTEWNIWVKFLRGILK